MSELVRSEQAGIEFPSMAWTSFDRYGRYGAIVRALRSSLGPGPIRVLDVGDSAGHLHTFDGELMVIGIDITVVTERLAGAVVAQADGTRLPFADDSFDAVVSSDVLEHVPPAGRPAFLAELQRVSRDLVIIAAPFDTPGVAGVEELVRTYALLTLGTEQPQLDEHRANGLPDLAATTELFRDVGWQVETIGDGHLWDWLVMMLLRFQLEARPALSPLSNSYDTLYNLSFAERSMLAPFYRHVVVARSNGEPRVGDRSFAPESTVDFASIAAALIAADSTEVSRQDTVPRLDHIQREVEGVQAQIAHLETRLEALIEMQVNVAEMLHGIRAKLVRVRHPFRRPT
ncbi:MAG: class I SAM-dependent methyltransferase [Actinomycetes bacterium]